MQIEMDFKEEPRQLEFDLIHEPPIIQKPPITDGDPSPFPQLDDWISRQKKNCGDNLATVHLSKLSKEIKELRNFSTHQT